MYGNLLTGVSRGEELVHQLAPMKDLGRRCGVNVDSMMISDVPGLTWGLIPALTQAGVKYISDGPNYADRIGWTRVTWEDRPFYWVAPNGKDKVLYWAPYFGYAFGHTMDKLPDAVQKDLKQLEETGYPYDLVQIRWSKGDNGSADERVMQQVRDWNAQHASPRLVIATTSEMFHEFEKRYADKIPTFRGDFTPYWEDGVGSSARETGLNRHSADRLSQAETLWALLNPGPFPGAEFGEAWKNVALYSEHTWGAYNSVSAPDLDFVKTQWKYKQAYALDADTQSRALLARIVSARAAAAAASPGAGSTQLDVFNTASWPRTDLVTLPKETQGEAVKDAKGQPVPSQRLASGELVFLARDVPALGSKRYRVEAGPAPTSGSARATGTTLSTPLFTVKLDESSGAIVSLRQQGLDAELVDGKLNDYLYLPGGNVKDVKSCASAKITVKEAGPLVASLLVESEAPSCRKLLREVRVVDGLDRVEIIDNVDKLPVRTPEGLHFGFEFNVPNAKVRFNSPMAVVEPEVDQIPGACKNWFSVERWVDVANADYGVTWATVDAPLVEMGGLTANLLRTPARPQGLPQDHPALCETLLLDHEQPLAHQLQGRPGRADRVPLRHPAAPRVRPRCRRPLRPRGNRALDCPAGCGRRSTPAAGANRTRWRCRDGLQAQRRRQGLDHPPVRGFRPGPGGAPRLEPAHVRLLHRCRRAAGSEGARAGPRARLEPGSSLRAERASESEQCSALILLALAGCLALSTRGRTRSRSPAPPSR